MRSRPVSAVDMIALMDALKIERATLAGFDWGARTANIMAALWPERCKAMVSVSGYLIGSREGQQGRRCRRRPSCNGGTSTTSRRSGGERGMRRTGVSSRASSGSSRPRSGPSTMRRSSAAPRPWTNADHVAIVIHNYRWRPRARRGGGEVDDLEKRLAAGPVISVPTITLEGDANGAPAPDAGAYAKKFTGKYAHRVIKGGVGHNPPQEAPQAFAESRRRGRRLLSSAAPPSPSKGGGAGRISRRPTGSM